MVGMADGRYQFMLVLVIILQDLLGNLDYTRIGKLSQHKGEKEEEKEYWHTSALFLKLSSFLIQDIDSLTSQYSITPFITYKWNCYLARLAYMSSRNYFLILCFWLQIKIFVDRETYRLMGKVKVSIDNTCCICVYQVQCKVVLNNLFISLCWNY